MAKHKDSMSCLEGLFQGVEPITASEVNDSSKFVKLEELHDFKNHPFRVTEDEEMVRLSESIQNIGIQEPLLIRKRPEGGYEVISGHRRKYAANMAGLKEVPCKVLEVDDAIAVQIMVDSNNKRAKILPSEKAKAYRMRAEALNHRGMRNDLLDEDERMEDSGTSMGKIEGYSSRTIQRYIRLSYLIEGLLELVDENKLPIASGVALSYFDKEEQQVFYDFYWEHKQIPNLAQLKELSEIRDSTPISYELLLSLLIKPKEIKEKKTTIKLSSEKLQSYFPEGTTNEEIEKVIFDLLDKWIKV